MTRTRTRTFYEASNEVPRTYENEATVLVWNTHMLAGRSGHAAIMLRGAAVATSHESEHGHYNYISWWPRNYGTSKYFTAVRPEGRMDGLPTALNSGTPSYARDVWHELGKGGRAALQDGSSARHGQVRMPGFDKTTKGVGERGEMIDVAIDEWGQVEDQRVALPALNPLVGELAAVLDPQPTLGVSVAAMTHWFETYRANQASRYKLVSRERNCAGVAVAALTEGGAGAFAKKPSAVFSMMPGDVATFARATAMGIARAQDAARRLYRAGQKENALPGGRGGCRDLPVPALSDLPGIDRWKAAAEGRGTNTELRAINSALKDYHRTPWGPGQFGQKYAGLIEVLLACDGYVTNRPTGTRRPAALALGLIALTVVVKYAPLTMAHASAGGLPAYTGR